MVNTGSLDLISNEELKMKILEIYSHYEKLNHFEDHLARDNRDNIYSLSIKLFDYEVTLGNDRNQFLKEFKKISNSLQMKNAYIMFNAVSGTMTELYTTGISKINQLDSLINIEIN
jgi:DNA-directed RNA polymerase beta' subunit